MAHFRNFRKPGTFLSSTDWKYSSFVAGTATAVDNALFTDIRIKVKIRTLREVVFVSVLAILRQPSVLVDSIYHLLANYFGYGICSEVGSRVAWILLVKAHRQVVLIRLCVGVGGPLQQSGIMVSDRSYAHAQRANWTKTLLPRGVASSRGIWVFNFARGAAARPTKNGTALSQALKGELEIGDRHRGVGASSLGWEPGRRGQAR